MYTHFEFIIQFHSISSLQKTMTNFVFTFNGL